MVCTLAMVRHETRCLIKIFIPDYSGVFDLHLRMSMRNFTLGEQETVTGKVPYSEKSDVSIHFAVAVKKLLPLRPEHAISSSSKDGNTLWSLLVSCWAYEPENRPSAEQVRDTVSMLKLHGNCFTHDSCIYVVDEDCCSGETQDRSGQVASCMLTVNLSKRTRSACEATRK